MTRAMINAVTGWGTPEQVAAICGLNRRTVRKWAQRGVIPVACEVRTRRLLVPWTAVFDRTTIRERAA